MKNNNDINSLNDSNICNGHKTYAKGNTLCSCEVLLTNNIWVYLPRDTNPDIKTTQAIKSKIIKKCSGKILIEGILCKKIEYESIFNPKYTVITKQDFNCYINVDDLSIKDEYKVIGCEVICDYTKHNFESIYNRQVCKLKDLNIVRVVIQKVCKEK